jgi:putative Mg2+ transporter-C (MgtC) family protein
VSFLGAATIFRGCKAGGIEGITTAASILLSSAVGLAVALDQFILAVGVTTLSLIVLRALKIV